MSCGLAFCVSITSQRTTATRARGGLWVPSGAGWPESAVVGGGLYVSAWLGIQPSVGFVAEVSRFTKHVGFEDGSGSASPTPGACVGLPTWQLYPYPCGGDTGSGYPYPANSWHGTCADRRQLLLLLLPPVSKVAPAPFPLFCPVPKPCSILFFSVFAAIEIARTWLAEKSLPGVFQFGAGLFFSGPNAVVVKDEHLVGNYRDLCVAPTADWGDIIATVFSMLRCK